MNIILTRLVIPRLQDPNITQEENAEDVTLNMKMENVRHLINYVLSATRRDTTVKFVKNKTYNNSRLNNINDESINNSTHICYITVHTMLMIGHLILITKISLITYM